LKKIVVLLFFFCLFLFATTATLSHWWYSRSSSNFRVQNEKCKKKKKIKVTDNSGEIINHRLNNIWPLFLNEKEFPSAKNFFKKCLSPLLLLKKEMAECKYVLSKIFLFTVQCVMPFLFFFCFVFSF
jgi:hypothetical protein